MGQAYLGWKCSKEDVETSKKYDDKNATSVVVQFGFKIDGYTGYKSRVLMGGDAEHEIWQHILDNNTDEEKLKWNVFLAPHHCSWSFFNNSDNKNEIKPSAEDILNKQIGNSAHIIASSNEIKNDNNNPPCYEAKQQYIKKRSLAHLGFSIRQHTARWAIYHNPLYLKLMNTERP